MKDYGIVTSSVKPENIKIDEYSVWVSTDIKLVSKEVEGQVIEEYEYHLTQYDKDEFIRKSLKSMETDITNTQVALCDIYESMGV